MADRPNIDLKRLAKLLAMSSSTHDGEVVNAIRLADSLLRKSGQTWDDVFHAFNELEAANSYARSLLSELNTARAEIVRLKADQIPRRTQPKLQLDEHQQVAEWALDLYEQRKIFLSSFEEEFLETVSDWEGDLTDKQQAVYERIIEKLRVRYHKIYEG